MKTLGRKMKKCRRHYESMLQFLFRFGGNEYAEGKKKKKKDRRSGTHTVTKTETAKKKKNRPKTKRN